MDSGQVKPIDNRRSLVQMKMLHLSMMRHRHFLNHESGNLLLRRGAPLVSTQQDSSESMHFKDRERPEKRAQAIALSIEDRRTNHWHQTAASLEKNQIQYFFGKRLRQYSLEELGKFQLITDILGGFSYTENLSQFMEKALALLEVGGSFYTMLQDVQAEHGANRPYYPGSPFLTEIVSAGGAKIKTCAWLKRISCVEVTCEFKAKDTPPLEVYRIHKVCDGVTVPALLPVHFEMGTPPERRFQVSNSPAR